MLTKEREVLRLISVYNNTDRKIIKNNLKRMMKQRGFKLQDIVDIGYNRHNAAAWTNKACNNIPMLDQALDLSVNFCFKIDEFLKEIEV